MLEGIERGITIVLFTLGVVAFALGGLAVWLVPKVWQWAKPLIHNLTA